MPSFTYIVPLPSVAESNETYIAKKLIKVVDCDNSIGPNELCGLWNFNRCPNDDDYCNPFITGDKLYFQYSYAGRKSKKAFPLIYDSATSQPIDPPAGLMTFETGAVGATEKKYLNVIIDTTYLPPGVTCFFVKLAIFQCDLSDSDEYLNCVEERMQDGMSEYLAQATCYDILCAEQETIWSEPYCIVRCHQDTILIEGQYPKYDCDGNYYGAFNGNQPNSFKVQVRIYGEVLLQGYSFEQTVVNNRTTRAGKRENYSLTSRKLPPYVVRQIAKAFGSQRVLIDGVEYLGTVSLNKNFDDGQMWILKEQIYRLCEDIDFSCQ